MNLAIGSGGRGQGRGVHGVLGPVLYTARPMPGDADSQVAMTVGIMRDRVMEDSSDLMFRERARSVLGYGAGNELELVERAWGHSRGGIKFVQDRDNVAGIQGLDLGDNHVVEAIVRPRDMAGYVDGGVAVGDCDDFTSYTAALLEACGVPCKFVTVAADSRDPNQYSHIYLIAFPVDAGTGQRVRVPVDASHGEYCGWETENKFGKRAEWVVRRHWMGDLVVGVAAWLAARWVWEKTMGKGTN